MFLSVSEVSLVTGLFGGHDYLRGLHVLSLEFFFWNGKEPGNIGLLGPDFLLEFHRGPRLGWRSGELQQAEAGVGCEVILLFLPLFLEH